MLLELLKPIGALVGYINFKADRLRLKRFMARGLKIGRNVYIGEKVVFDPIYPYLIEIGDDCRITSGTSILAHDATIFRELGVTRVAPVRILEGTFIGARCIILPGVTIGPRAMIAAGSVVNRDIGEDKVAAGNPARPYGSYSDLVNKYRNLATSAPIFMKKDMEKGAVTPRDLARVLEKEPFVLVGGIPSSDPYYVNVDMEKIRRDALRVQRELTRIRSAGSSHPAEPKQKGGKVY